MTSRCLLHFSFWSNVLLLAAVLWSARSWSQHQPTPDLRNQEAWNAARPAAKARHRPVVEGPSAPFQTAGQFSWSQLESTDYLDYVARLRAVGCPEPTV